MSVEVGELEHGTGHPVSRDAAFAIGSITKSFTATVAMILAADGDLELDAPLADELPELGHGSDDLGRQLTLRDLLSRTSGLYLGPESTQVAGASTSSRPRPMASPRRMPVVASSPNTASCVAARRGERNARAPSSRRQISSCDHR